MSKNTPTNFGQTGIIDEVGFFRGDTESERASKKPTQKKIVYSEPPDYFPEELRKEFGLGEYAPGIQKDDDSRG